LELNIENFGCKASSRTLRQAPQFLYKLVSKHIDQTMKILKLFIFLILIISCSDKKSENKMFEFDKVLGNENVAILDLLVSDFENDFLKRQYPNLHTENAYRQFLTDLRDEKTDNFLKISQKARETFKYSNLRLEIYRYPDSVWIVENSSLDKKEDSLEVLLYSSTPYIKSRHKYDNPDGTFEYLYSRSYRSILPNMNFDSIAESEIKKPEFNTVGKYIQALYQIKELDTFFKKFYKQKSAFGFVRPSILANALLNEKVDLNDNLVKRIIVLEIAY
jgi:hypothetical protein